MAESEDAGPRAKAVGAASAGRRESDPNEKITAHVRFKGGITKTLTAPRPLNSWQARMTPAEVVAEIDRLLDHYTENEIAGILNKRGIRSGEGKLFNSRAV